ncbi:MAG: hypothetical protein FJ118_02595 [Deltaproteobacteria bacterium]|nr:hypothetical protein [Deltaproteobacteria bacterium]
MPKNAKRLCPDCAMCQGCSESRCRACRSTASTSTKHCLSIREQIALYNSLNPHLSASNSQTCVCHGANPSRC